MAPLRALGCLSFVVVISSSLGCTSAGLAFNALGDMSQDAQLRSLNERVEQAEKERDGLRARLSELQRRVDGIERAAILNAGANAASSNATPVSAATVALPPRSRDIPPEL